jgi:dihydrodipicolinate synthase/N-acetylneuraminate lyase
MTRPFYTKPTQAEIIRHSTAVLDAVDVNLVLCSYPGRDGVEIDHEALDALADHPRVIGIKESSGVLQRAIGIATRYGGGGCSLCRAPTTSRSTSCSGGRTAGSAGRPPAWPSGL